MENLFAEVGKLVYSQVNWLLLNLARASRLQWPLDMKQLNNGTSVLMYRSNLEVGVPIMLAREVRYGG